MVLLFQEFEDGYALMVTLPNIEFLFVFMFTLSSLSCCCWMNKFMSLLSSSSSSEETPMRVESKPVKLDNPKEGTLVFFGISEVVRLLITISSFFCKVPELLSSSVSSSDLPSAVSSFVSLLIVQV